LNFFHQQLLFVVKERYIPADKKYFNTIHTILSNFYFIKTNPSEESSTTSEYFQFKGLNERAFNQIIFHFQNAELFDKLTTIICSLFFINKRYIFNQGVILLNEYIEVLKDPSLPTNCNEIIRQYFNFLRINNFEFTRFISGATENEIITNCEVNFVLQKAINSDPRHSPHRHSKNFLEKFELRSKFYLLPIFPFETNDECFNSLKGHTDSVSMDVQFHLMGNGL